MPVPEASVFNTDLVLKLPKGTLFNKSPAGSGYVIWSSEESCMHVYAI